MQNLPVEDRKLPGLARALNGEEMRAALAQTLRLHDEVRVEPRLLKHAPGKRGVIEYRLFLRDAVEPAQRIFAKLYRKERGAAVFENLQDLWRASSRGADRAPRFLLPEPLGYLPQMGMVLQRAAPGRPLSLYAPNESWDEAIRRVATNLAALHNLTTRRGETKTLQQHFEKYTRPGLHDLSAACPQLQPVITKLVGGLFGEEGLQSAPLVPAHGDLNRAQIFITAEAAYFIDFDGFCCTHAALDLGNFLVTVQTHCGEAGTTLQKIFLKTYCAHASAERLAGLRVYQALAYLRRAMIAFRAQAEAGWRAQVSALLEKGLAVLKHDLLEETQAEF